jgi:hypothetical protein
MGDILVGQHIATADGAAILRLALLGSSCTSVDKEEYSWHFGFGSGGAALSLECLWRLRASGCIAYGRDDDGQTFGLPEPVDGVAMCERLIGRSPVASLEIRDGCGDLSVEFKNGVMLEVFNGSAAYEGWTFSRKDGLLVVAQGGGRLAVCDPSAASKDLS